MVERLYSMIQQNLIAVHHPNDAMKRTNAIRCEGEQGPAGGGQSVITKPVWANQGFSSYMDFLRLPSRSPHCADTSQIQCLKYFNTASHFFLPRQLSLVLCKSLRIRLEFLHAFNIRNDCRRAPTSCQMGLARQIILIANACASLP